MERRELVKTTIDYLNRLNEMLKEELKLEEEKKYRLLFPKGFSSVKIYLSECKGSYDRTHDLNAYNKIDYHTIFTQKEIDEMPFDTSFFVKEEV
jgi:hypothetical protein